MSLYHADKVGMIKASLNIHQHKPQSKISKAQMLNIYQRNSSALLFSSSYLNLFYQKKLFSVLSSSFEPHG